MSEKEIKKEDTSAYDTPMMKQHKELKDKYPDAFLFFRCGDFYEMFAEDAVAASKLLNITLTKRQNEIPMCGVPYHAVNFYIKKLVSFGKKIAICEQLEDPKMVKGLVKRGITEIITPGTIVKEDQLVNKSNNYLLGLNAKGMWLEVAYIDISTGEFEIIEQDISNGFSVLRGEMCRLAPREVIAPKSLLQRFPALEELLKENEGILINRFDEQYFLPEENQQLLLTQFSAQSLRQMGLSELKTDLTVPGALLKYLKNNFQVSLAHIRPLRYHNNDDTMQLDESTIKHLELLRNQNDGTATNSLLETLDCTLTSMGGRLLKKWIVSPLLAPEKINKRLDIVEVFVKTPALMSQLEACVKNITDLERLAGRLVMDKATPKDLISIKISLSECDKILELLGNIPQLEDLFSTFMPLPNVVEMLEQRIKDEPATFIDDGNIVKDGFSKELDELKLLANQSKEYINGIEARIRSDFDVPTLRIKYNKILGYFFEVSKIQSKNLSDDFILRQSLVNTCRYTNKELSEYESKVLTARERINEIEKNIFLETKDILLESLVEIQQDAEVISKLDVLLSFAKNAIQRRYVRPSLNDGFDLQISEGRHPVVETKMDYDEFIPNDTNIGTKDYLMIITGPNMAGKSTYLRQNALIILMAQIGCFVPAAKANIGVVDRIFTRIGTSDNLARGQSTFFVEMQETANILKYATGRSLIIMDEIGRGTSTYDGLAIAWAILDYIHDKRILGAKTLFATHYHELTQLDKKEGIKNYCVAIKEDGTSFTFLHKIIPEAAQKSYGIHVAELAGMPDAIVEYAKKLLVSLEQNNNGKANEQNITKDVAFNEAPKDNLFDFHENYKEDNASKEICNAIKFLDLDRMTPIQALNMLYDLQKKTKKEKK
jgi:DNA mismatch repair protein MutS